MNNSFQEQEIYTAGSLDVFEWDLDFHQLMLNDKLRMDAYKKAIFEVVKPGMIVCEIGVGTGILSQWALEAGAKVVYGIESNSKILEIAKTNLSSFGDKFVPIEGLSSEVSLQEKVDLILSEIIGNIADNENMASILADAQKRFLKDGGVMIPIKVESFIVPVSTPEANNHILKREINPTHKDSKLIDKFNTIPDSGLFTFYFDTLISENSYLAKPEILESFYENNWPISYSNKIEFKIIQDGLLTGFKGWFSAQLSKDTILNIESSEDYSDSWKHAYFPLEKSVEVKRGSTVVLEFTRSENGKYFWKLNK